MAILLDEDLLDTERSTFLSIMAPDMRAEDIRLHQDVRSAARAVLHAGLGALHKPKASHIRDAARDLAAAYVTRAPALAPDGARREAYAVEAERAVWAWFRQGCAPDKVQMVSSIPAVQDLLTRAPWHAAWGPATARLEHVPGTGLPDPSNLPALRAEAESIGLAVMEAARTVAREPFITLLRAATSDQRILFGALSQARPKPPV